MRKVKSAEFLPKISIFSGKGIYASTVISCRTGGSAEVLLKQCYVSWMFIPGPNFFIPDPGSQRSRIQNHIQKCKYEGSLEKFFGVKILTFFEADPGSGMEKIRIRDGQNSDLGSGINGSATPSATLIVWHCLE